MQGEGCCRWFTIFWDIIFNWWKSSWRRKARTRALSIYWRMYMLHGFLGKITTSELIHLPTRHFHHGSSCMPGKCQWHWMFQRNVRKFIHVAAHRTNRSGKNIKQTRIPAGWIVAIDLTPEMDSKTRRKMLADTAYANDSVKLLIRYSSVVMARMSWHDKSAQTNDQKKKKIICNSAAETKIWLLPTPNEYDYGGNRNSII